MKDQLVEYGYCRDKESEQITFVDSSVNGLVSKAVLACASRGEKSDSRNGACRSLEDTTLILTDPTNRHINLDWRKSNIFQIVAETLWVLAGEEKLEPYLSFFLPRAHNYSDDGVKWHDAYGPRIIDPEFGGQLQDALELLLANRNERRAMVSIYDPNKDSKSALAAKGVTAPKGVPCNNTMWFWIRGDKLKAKVAQRSGDIFYGTGSINLFEFTMIQELMQLLYNANIQPNEKEVGLGEYRHNVINLHYYENDIINPQVRDAGLGGHGRRWPNSVFHNDDKRLPLTIPNGAKSWASVALWCSCTVDALSELITCDQKDLVAKALSYWEFLESETEGVWREYVKALICYIVGKRAKGTEGDNLVKPLTLNINAEFDAGSNLAPAWSFHRAVVASNFRNFPINLKV